MLKFFSQSDVDHYSNSSSEQSDHDADSSSEQFDENTKCLFEQLEEGATHFTDIEGTIKDGADLYAKKTKGYFTGYYPIHVAAHNLLSNITVFDPILRTFNDPEERKKYIFLKNDNNQNAIEILLNIEFEYYVVNAIITIFSYLTPDDQREIIDNLNEHSKETLDLNKTPISHEKEIKNLATLNYWLRSGKSIEMCKQRRDEAQKIYEEYDSDDESLGKLDAVYNKKCTAKVYYQESTNTGVTSFQPELILIPSDWRLDTALSNQGDHVTAYVLLLSSFSHCKGENIKKLPNLVHELAMRVLPDFQDRFNKKKNSIDTKLTSLRDKRVKAISALKAHTSMKSAEIDGVEIELKKSEIDAIGSYLEDTIDFFIKTINKLTDESFSHERKNSITKQYTLTKLSSILQQSNILADEKYCAFKAQLIQAIQNESLIKPNDTQVTDKCLETIIKAIDTKKLIDAKIPTIFLSKSCKLNKSRLLIFLKESTPFKKYHEGHVIKDIKEDLTVFQQTKTANTRAELLLRIGFHCFKLFDYPRVNDNNNNSIAILCQAIPRHWIIINAAFSDLQKLSLDDREIIYEAFLNHILVLQDWGTYIMPGVDGATTTLEMSELKKLVLDYAHLDDKNNFVMSTDVKSIREHNGNSFTL